jgi:hypothetical protein
VSAAATLEKPDRLVSTPDSTVVFMSRRTDLKLVKLRERARRNAEGDVAEVLPGERVAFRDGVLRVPASGKMRGEQGEELDAVGVLKWLLAHPMLDDRFEGFWRLEEPAPAPTEAEQATLAALGMELDIDGLEAFIAQEEAGWAREDLLGVARGSLERAKRMAAEREDALAKARAEGAAEAAAKPAGKKPEAS